VHASAAIPRVASELAVQAAAGRGVRASVVRLSPTVHGAGDHGFVPRLIDIARHTGISAFVGDGANRWPAVHRLDAARSFDSRSRRQRRERACMASPKRVYHARDCSDDRHGARPSGPEPHEDEALAHFAWLAPFVAVDNPTSSAITRRSLGWRPRDRSS